MSTAVYPLGMRSNPSSGYTHHGTYPNMKYVTWKGTGINSNPVGSAPGHIRPLTNNDPGNVFPTGFGLPRPIKHYRKGRVIMSAPAQSVPVLDVSTPYNVTLKINENGLINYNLFRFVKSSKGTSLGGGSGGSGLLSETMDKPGSYSIKENKNVSMETDTDAKEYCEDCKGVPVIANYYPNNWYLTENPNADTMNPKLCCNEQYKARRRSIYANTNLNKNYYTTTAQYLQNRCKTYEQKAFNFLAKATNSNADGTPSDPYLANYNKIHEKPGGPLSETNLYLANCFPNAQIYDATENAYIESMIDVMVTQEIITSQEATDFYNLQITTLPSFYEWIQTLPSPQKEEANAVFTFYLKNPYIGIPPYGPIGRLGCQLTVYKPNNYQFAKQGAVSSSTRLLKLQVDTISTNAASLNRNQNIGQQLITANQIARGDDPATTNILKNKAPPCGTGLPLNFYQSRFQNKRICSNVESSANYNLI